MGCDGVEGECVWKGVCDGVKGEVKGRSGMCDGVKGRSVYCRHVEISSTHDYCIRSNHRPTTRYARAHTFTGQESGSSGVGVVGGTTCPQALQLRQQALNGNHDPLTQLG